MVIGYLRVSTGKQHLANQKSEIVRFASGHGLEIEKWVTEISRLSRTLTDIMNIMGKCLERGINLYTTKDGYSFDDTINSKVLCLAFGLVAEIERNLISMRTKEALAARKAAGKSLGRKKGSYTKLNILIKNRDTIDMMLGQGEPIGNICKRFKISRDTFAKFRKLYCRCPC